jgi:hypothetical protein
MAAIATACCADEDLEVLSVRPLGPGELTETLEANPDLDPQDVGDVVRLTRCRVCGRTVWWYEAAGELMEL